MTLCRQLKEKSLSISDEFCLYTESFPETFPQITASLNAIDYTSALV
jgi:hypothetical protein